MQSQKNYKRIVIKVSSGSLFWNNNIAADVFGHLVEQVASLSDRGHEVIIVSSGAIALGMHILKMKNRPKELSCLQAVAAIGQHRLMGKYQSYFEKRNKNCAQILLTYDDFDNRKRYLNARNTILTLWRLKSIPVVNENDTISADEIKFGDNDKLSSLVASMVEADLLIMLSDVDGLLDRQGKVIRVINEIDSGIKALASPTKKQTSVGGMVTKLEAAKIAIAAGIPCVIANGNKQDVIVALAADAQKYGTLFISRKSLSAKQSWMAYGTKSKGKILVDDGAKKALLNKKSLLSVGIVSCSGNFSCGDIVSICDNRDVEFARGKAGLAVRELEKVQGKRFGKEIIHRDNIVIL
ncbi:MAG: glutamate 5-kinase [Candidatus Omnitrophica bacterium]|nr:glutamate 5-kinase [Candidatus Omnitrophota bacterium]